MPHAQGKSSSKTYRAGRTTKTDDQSEQSISPPAAASISLCLRPAESPLPGSLTHRSHPARCPRARNRGWALYSRADFGVPGTSCALPAHFSQFCILPIHASQVGSALISTVEFSPPKPLSLSLTAPRFCPLSIVCGVGFPAGGALLSHTHTEQYGSRRVSPLLGLSVSALDLDVLKISDTPACPRGPLAPGGQSFFTVSKSRPLWHDRRATQ